MTRATSSVPIKAAVPVKATVASWLGRVAKGMVISLGFILPGVSGGVLAAILGLYERLLRFLAHVRRDFVANLLFFLPVGIGGVLGLVLLSRPLTWLLERWQVPVLWGFAGAILGTVPALLRTAERHGRRSRLDLAVLVGTALLAGELLYWLPVWLGTAPANFGGFVLAGVLIALGTLLPGFSPSNLLLILGLFTPMLAGFHNRDVLGVFVPIVIGGLATVLTLSKAMERLLDRYHSRVYHVIIGLVLASTVLIVVPTHSAETIDYAGISGWQVAAAVVAFVVGVGVGLWMVRLEAKYQVDEVVAETAQELSTGAIPVV